MGLSEQEKNELGDLLCMETVNEEKQEEEEEKNTNTAALAPSLEKVLDALKRSLKSQKVHEDRVQCPYCEEEHYARDTVKCILFCEHYMDK